MILMKNRKSRSSRRLLLESLKQDCQRDCFNGTTQMMKKKPSNYAHAASHPPKKKQFLMNTTMELQMKAMRAPSTNNKAKAMKALSVNKKATPLVSLKATQTDANQLMNSVLRMDYGSFPLVKTKPRTKEKLE